MPEPLKLYFDENVAKEIALQLRAKGVDVLRCQEVGLGEADDPIHLEYAIEQGRAIVSFDNDFKHLHQQYMNAEKSHMGIFHVAEYLQGDGGIGTIVTTLLDLHLMIEGEAGTVENDIHNQLIIIKRK
jgi:Domain of unknown function (DUF5615)